METPAMQLLLDIDWSAERKRWQDEDERHEKAHADHVRELASRGATQQQIAAELGLSQPYISQLAAYGAVAEKLIATAINSDIPVDRDPPTEWELRPYIEQAAQEIAEERGIERVRSGREEVYERAAELYETRSNIPQQHNSGENEWYTPAEFIAAVREVMGSIDLDPASSAEANEVVKAKHFLTKDDDGLAHPWFGRVFMNPPYSGDKIGSFAEKMAAHYARGDIDESITLVNNATETDWFAKLSAVSEAVCFPLRRVRFWSPRGESAAPLQGQALLYMGPNSDEFCAVFKRFGGVARWVR